MKTANRVLRLFGALLLSGAPLLAQTPLSSPMLAGTLKLSESPYVVDGPRRVPDGATLEIEAGVEILMIGQGSGIEVRGTLEVAGTAEKPVVFRSAVDPSVPGAWKGIEFAESSRGDLRWLQVRHARRAVLADGAEVWLRNVRLSESAEAAVYANGSKVRLSDCEIGEGSPSATAVVAVNGSDVEIQRGKVSGARTGIAATGYSSVVLLDAFVEKNELGLLLVDSVSVDFSGARVADNTTGVSSNFDVRAKLTGLAAALGLYGDEEVIGYPPEVRDNYRDWTQTPGPAGRQLFASQNPPAGTDRILVRPAGYSGGVHSEELVLPGTDFFGSVTLGFEYHGVRTDKNETGAPVVVGADTVLPGDRYPNRHYVGGFRPYLSYYSQARFGTERVLETQAFVAWDDWADWTTKPVTLSWESPQNHLRLGHFVENGADLVVSGLPLLGASYVFNTPTAGRTRPFLTVQAVAGEVRSPLSEGDRDPDIFGEVILPGGARAQELFLLGRLAVSPFWGIEVAAGAMRDWDRREDPYLRDEISSRSVLEEDPVDALGFFGELSWRSPGGEFEARATLVHSSADSSQRSWSLAVERWLDENNVFVEADTLRSLLLRKNAIGVAQLERALPPRLGKSGRQVLDELRSLSSDIRDSLTKNYVGGIDLTPTGDNFAGAIDVSWRHAKSAVEFGCRYLGRNFVSPGSPNLVSNSREYTVRLAQGVSYWWDVEANAALTVEDASAHASHLNFFGFGEGSLLGVDSDPEALERLGERRTRPRLVLDVDLSNRWTIPGGFELRLGYDYGVRRRRTARTLQKNVSSDAGVFADPFFASASSDADVFYYNSGAYKVDSARWSAYDALPDTLGRGFVQKLVSHRLSANLSWTRSWLTLSGGTELRWDLDESEFDHYSFEKSDWKLADTTWSKMGHLYGQNDAFIASFPLEFRARTKRFDNRLRLQWTSRDYADLERAESEWSLMESFEWRAIPGRLSILPELGWRYRSVDELETVGGKTRKTEYAEEYTDFYASLGSRYAITPRWHVALAARWDLIDRSETPEENVTDLSSDFNVTYEF